MSIEVNCGNCSKGLAVENGSGLGAVILIELCPDCIETAREEERAESAGLASELEDLKKKHLDLVEAMRLLLDKYQSKTKADEGTVG